MDQDLANSDLPPTPDRNRKMQILKQSHLLGSLVFLLLWRPSMMEKEVAGSNSSLSSSYRQ